MKRLHRLVPFGFAFGLLLLSSCGGGGGGGGGAPLALSYPSPQALTLGTALTPLEPTVSGAVAAYVVSPPLPGGISLDPASGRISGTPVVTSAAAIYRVNASNDQGSTSFDLSIAVDHAQPFWIEPALQTVIGVGQTIPLYPAYKSDASAEFPAYLDAADVSWTSSRPECATIDAGGRVNGIGACTTEIAASYLGHTRRLTVQVSGTWIDRTVAVPGQGMRSYSVYRPDFGGLPGPHPALLALHGGGGSAAIQASTSQLVKLAHAQKVVVAFLEGSGVIRTFNAGACCGYAKTNNIDDVAYTRAVLDSLQASDPVDAARIHATGMSNGGMMSHRLACALADRLAGIAAVTGASGQFDQALTPYYTCTPARRIPVLHIHASNDRNYPYAGGAGDGLSGTAYYPVDSTIADWRVRNNVTNVASVERVTATTTCHRYDEPADTGLDSAPVTLCRIDPVDRYEPATGIVFGGGHSWPGGARSPSPSSDTPVMDFNANDYLWRFLDR